MTTPVTVSEARDRARRLFDRDAREWAASGRDDVVLDLPLHPPTERAALGDLPAARDWVDQWQRCELSEAVVVAWRTRTWARVGSQAVPERLRVEGPAAIASFAGRDAVWTRLSARLHALRDLVGAGSVATIRSHARDIDALSDADFARLSDVVKWLGAHPVSGRRVRELPIRGIDTKWIDRRRSLLEALHRAGTGSSGLGLHEPDPLVRMRCLDPALAVGGLSDVSAPVGELSMLDMQPERVFVFENLATVLAMPHTDGAVVLHGGGHRVEPIARLPWARTVTYWGDLDSHGFAILHRLRAHGVRATSVLMDTDTLLEHRDMWGSDPDPNVSVLSGLTTDENATLRLLSSAGNVRLEQERIPWDYALAALQATS